MLDYRSMKHTTLSAAILVTFLLFGVTGCSSSQQQTNATPASSDQPAQAPSQAEASSSQSASEAPAPQPTAPQQQAAPSPIGSPTVTPASSATPGEPAPKVPAQPAPGTGSSVQPAAPVQAKVTVAPEPGLDTEKAPKLLIATPQMDFGKQPQDKTLNRAIAIRNTGKSNLLIESVTPG